jgi:hypothetical protein
MTNLTVFTRKTYKKRNTNRPFAVDIRLKHLVLDKNGVSESGSED